MSPSESKHKQLIRGALGSLRTKAWHSQPHGGPGQRISEGTLSLKGVVVAGVTVKDVLTLQGLIAYGKS